jgi:hypothetical protein
MNTYGYVAIGVTVFVMGICIWGMFFESDEHDVWWTPEWLRRWRERHKLALGRRGKQRDPLGRRVSDTSGYDHVYIGYVWERVERGRRRGDRWRVVSEGAS